MLNKLKLSLTTAAALTTLATSAMGIGTIISQTNYAGATTAVPELSPFTMLSDYIGMEVIVHYCDGSTEASALAPTSIPNYPVGSSGSFSVTAGAVGSRFTAFAYPHSSGTVGLEVRGLLGANICAVEFYAPTAGLVFDRTSPNPGSLGSTAGRDASLLYQVGNSDYRMNYVDQIEVGGMMPAGDTYARLVIEFANSPLDLNDIISIDVDTDFIGFEPNRGIPDVDDTTSTPADYNGDGRVDGEDLGRLLGSWGRENPELDLNGDLWIDGADLTMLLGEWK